jgi:N12 class adenine-specific DNA methylase
MAIMQHLSTDDDSIVVEQEFQRLVVSTMPDQWEVGTRLNEGLIGDAHQMRDDALSYATEDNDDEDKENVEEEAADDHD